MTSARPWLSLPNDISIGYFDDPVSERGLGIAPLPWLAPLRRKDRLLGLVPGWKMENITDPYLAKEIGQYRQRLTESALIYTTQEEIKKRWAAIAPIHGLLVAPKLASSHRPTPMGGWCVLTFLRQKLH